MKEINELKLPADRRYSSEHEWALEQGGVIRVGIDDYAQDRLGEVVFVELPEVGTTVSRGDTLSSVESVKAVSEIYCPVSGEITAVNGALEDAPELINTDCYAEGWIAEIKPANADELGELLDSDAYRATLED